MRLSKKIIIIKEESLLRAEFVQKKAHWFSRVNARNGVPWDGPKKTATKKKKSDMQEGPGWIISKVKHPNVDTFSVFIAKMFDNLYCNYPTDLKLGLN